MTDVRDDRPSPSEPVADSASIDPAEGNDQPRPRSGRTKPQPKTKTRGTHAAANNRGHHRIGLLALTVVLCASTAFALVAFTHTQQSATVQSGASAAAMAGQATTLGGAVGAAAPGLPSPYYQPPFTTHLATPARTIDSGRDAPDPFVFLDHGMYYLFTSEGNLATVNVPVRSAPTMGHWGRLRDAMPTLPTWAEQGFTWAPDVHRFGHHYVMYFTSIVHGSTPSIECIGDAVSTAVAGPYRAAPEPFICQRSQEGSIDPRTFTDESGTTYLIWKSDENADVNATSLTNIYAQPLTANGLARLGHPKRIFGPDEPWQGRIVEAPDMIQVDGSYYLFYSGNWFNQPYYAVGVAHCVGPLGPCADQDPNPWLTSNQQGAGPGEASLFADRSGVWLVYSPFRSDLPKFTTPPRPVDLVRVGFGGLGPYLANSEPSGAGGPTTSP